MKQCSGRGCRFRLSAARIQLVTFKNHKGREPGTLPKAANLAAAFLNAREEKEEERRITRRRLVRARDGAPRFLASSRSSLASRAKSFHFHRDRGNAYLRSAPRTKASRRRWWLKYDTRLRQEDRIFITFH